MTHCILFQGNLKSNVYSISKLNKLKDINQIKVGQRIQIPEYFEQKKNNPTLKKKKRKRKKKLLKSRVYQSLVIPKNSFGL